MHEVKPAPMVTLGGTLSDEEVVRRILQGDTALFEVLMRRHNQRLFRTARGIVRDDGEAEDAMQQAYLNAYLHLDQFEDRARFSTWLTRIAIHEALARARRAATGKASARTTDVPDVDRFHAGAPTPEHQAFASELGRLLETAVDALPQPYRLVFVLREIEGLSTAETSECLDIAEDTVKTRLYRARALLRRELGARAGAATAEAFRFYAPRCDRVVARVLERIREDSAIHPGVKITFNPSRA